MSSFKSYVDVFLSPSTQHYLTNNTVVGRWIQEASAVFWQAEFWLPPEVDWVDLESSEDLPLPSFYDVWVYPLMLGVFLLLLLSFCIQPYLLDPLARAAGISNKRSRPPVPSQTLEVLYQRYKLRPLEEEMKEAVSVTGMSERQVERWLRRRHAVTRETKHEKFIQCAFNLLCHLVLLSHVCHTLLGKVWVWDISQCWQDHPFHPLDSSVWWYYILGLSYFWAVTFQQIHSPGRSTFDKIQMMLHHLFTILLMVFSWVCNYVRVGTLVLMVHEVCDIFLLSAKLFVYTGIKGTQDALFVMFIISWIITRCYLYPFWIMRSCMIYYQTLNDTPSGTVFVALLFGLLALNIVWTVLIGNVVAKKLTAGKLEDVRSDVEDFCTEDEDEDVVVASTIKTKAD